MVTTRRVPNAAPERPQGLQTTTRRPPQQALLLRPDPLALETRDWQRALKGLQLRISTRHGLEAASMACRILTSARKSEIATRRGRPSSGRDREKWTRPGRLPVLGSNRHRAQLRQTQKLLLVEASRWYRAVFQFSTVGMASEDRSLSATRDEKTGPRAW